MATDAAHRGAMVEEWSSDEGQPCATLLTRACYGGACHYSSAQKSFRTPCHYPPRLVTICCTWLTTMCYSLRCFVRDVLLISIDSKTVCAGENHKGKEFSQPQKMSMAAFLKKQ